MVELVRVSLLLSAVYGALGLFFAVAFHLRGLGALDAGAHAAGPGFRLLITPGIVALWPLLALRWWRATHGGSFLGDADAPFSARGLRATHALGWKVIVVMVPLVVVAALWWRPNEAPSSTLPTQHEPFGVGRRVAKPGAFWDTQASIRREANGSAGSLALPLIGPSAAPVGRRSAEPSARGVVDVADRRDTHGSARASPYRLMSPTLTRELFFHLPERRHQTDPAPSAAEATHLQPVKALDWEASASGLP